MTDVMRDMIQGWDGQAVVTHFDAPSGTWFFITIHDTTLGPAVGGCRMWTYMTPDEGLMDAMRLAEGMTYKWACVNVPFGGGKAVLATPGSVEGEARQALLRRFGHLLNTLNGALCTGVDLGTTPADFEVMSKVTSHVLGQVGDGKIADPGPYTALGVFTGIRMAIKHVFDGDESLAGRRVFIQGVGDVGRPLAGMLKEEGVRLLFADIDETKAQEAAREFSGEMVPAGAVYYSECDVYAPCAIGATLNSDTIPKLRCRAVAGSANNQLDTPDDADRLQQHGILYAPDYIINAGGAIAFAMIQKGIKDKDKLRSQVLQIGTALDEIFEEAARNNETPEKSARERAMRVLRGNGKNAEQSAA